MLINTDNEMHYIEACMGITNGIMVSLKSALGLLPLLLITSTHLRGRNGDISRSYRNVVSILRKWACLD